MIGARARAMLRSSGSKIDQPHIVPFVKEVSKSMIELHNSVLAALHRLCGYRSHSIEEGAGPPVPLTSSQPYYGYKIMNLAEGCTVACPPDATRNSNVASADRQYKPPGHGR